MERQLFYTALIALIFGIFSCKVEKPQKRAPTPDLHSKEEEAPPPPATTAAKTTNEAEPKSDEGPSLDAAARANRAPDDPRAYDFCGNDHSQLNEARLKTIQALEDTLQPKESLKNCSEEILDFILKQKSIDLSQKEISDIAPLGIFKNLEVLKLSNNNIQGGLDELAGLKQLHTLFVNNNRLSNLNGIGLAPELRYLNAANNEITTVNVFEGMDNLQVLNLQNNKLATIIPLLTSSIDVVDISGNESAIQTLKNYTSPSLQCPVNVATPFTCKHQDLTILIGKNSGDMFANPDVLFDE